MSERWSLTDALLSTTVTIEPASGGRWRVVLRRGDAVTVVGTHTAKFKATAQADALRSPQQQRGTTTQ